MPALVTCLSNNDLFAHYTAADALGKFGTDAKPAIPALIALLNDPLGLARQAATNALLQIDPEAAAKAGVK